MYKQKAGHAVSAVRMAFAMIPLAACDSGDIERPGARFAELGFVAQREAAVGLTKTTAVEHRHFDFYTRYRAMFDAAPEGPAAGVSDLSNAFVQDAGMEQGSLSEAGPSCSMRMLLMPD